MPLYLIRNSTRYVSYKDLKKVTADPKPINKAIHGHYLNAIKLVGVIMDLEDNVLILDSGCFRLVFLDHQRLKLTLTVMGNCIS